MAQIEAQDTGLLNSVAKAVGSAAGKVVATVGGKPEKPETAKPVKANLYTADYIGSGTFIIHKPKRDKAKARQSRLRGRRRGARK